MVLSASQPARSLALPPAAFFFMKPEPLPEVLLRRDGDAQDVLPLASDGVLRYVWHSRFGPMLIEVAGDEILVNGSRVEPAPPAPRPAPR